MRLTIKDIESNKTAEGWAQDLPQGVTLAEVFKRHDKLKLITTSIVQVKANGRQLVDWRKYTPDPGDYIEIVLLPGDGFTLAGLVSVLEVLTAIVSVASFIVSLFQKPQKPQEARSSSPTYTFEGIQDTFEPGNPVPVVYGKQRKGGQVLMYFLQMLPDRSGLAMNLLLSMGEGPVDSIDDVEINEISVSALSSVTVITRLGTDSQPMFEPFQQIANTFHDGREITDEFKNGRSGGGEQSSIVYRTVGHDVRQVDLFVAALQGLTCIGKSSGSFYPQWSRYKVEIHDSGRGANECDETVWQHYTERTVQGRFQSVYWDDFPVFLPYASRWDIRLTWLDARCHPVRANPGLFTYRLWLQEVTEIRGTMPDINNEALLAVQAAPTRDLHGGRPNVTAIVRGLKPKVYSSVDSYVTQWTQNPAWCVADYMTNSRYGMGAYINESDLDIQSFLDFATLADSTINTCEAINEAYLPPCTGLLAVGGEVSDRQSIAMTSPDAFEWQVNTHVMSASFYGLAYSPELRYFAAVGVFRPIGFPIIFHGKIATSRAGASWTQRHTQQDRFWNSVAWSSPRRMFAAVGGFPQGTGIATREHVAVSTNGTDWSLSETDTYGHWFAVTWAKDRFVAIGHTADYPTASAVSTNGVNWSVHSAVAGVGDWDKGGVAYSESLGLIVAAGNSRIQTSTDGINWTLVKSATGIWTDIVWSPERGQFVVVGMLPGDYRAAVSTNGTSWTIHEGFGGNLQGVCYSKSLDLFVAVGFIGKVAVSTDGSSWTEATDTDSNISSSVDSAQYWRSIVAAAPELEERFFDSTVWSVSSLTAATWTAPIL